MPEGLRLQYIKPKPFDKLPFRTELIRAGSKIVKEQEKDFIKTTSKWKKKPKWVRQVDHFDNAIIVQVYTLNKIYGYVDYGTKKHPIVPKKAEFLRFRGSSYRGRGRPRASDYVYTKFVMHPGFKGYQHTIRITKKWTPKILIRFEAAIARAAKQSGHHVK